MEHTIDCVCSKILNHGLNHGLLFSLFKFFGWYFYIEIRLKYQKTSLKAFSHQRRAKPFNTLRSMADLFEIRVILAKVFFCWNANFDRKTNLAKKPFQIFTGRTFFKMHPCGVAFNSYLSVKVKWWVTNTKLGDKQKKTGCSHKSETKEGELALCLP